MSDQVILRVATKIIVPTVLLYALVFGLRRTQKVVPSWVARLAASTGVLIYAGVGVVSLFLGGNFLDYSALAHDPEHGQHLGILLVEIGVMTTVLGVMLTIFYFFAARGREDL